MCLQFCHIFCLSIDTESCCHLSQTILYNATATRAFDDDKGEDKDYANDSNEYIIIQEDMENLIQKECEIRFSLAHSPPIMSTLLDDRLRYLGDEELARSIITGTFGILADLDPVTTLILKKIEKMGLTIMNGEGKDIIITPEEFTHFWKKVGEFTSSSGSGEHYGHFKAAIQGQMSTQYWS